MSANAGSWGAQQGAGGHKWWTLVAMCFGLFMVLLDITIVNVALPTIRTKLNASFSDLQWVVNAYVVALAVFIVTAGRLGDIFGRKLMFMVGLSIFTLGSLLCALAGDLTIGSLSHTTVLNVARAIQGIGGSFIFPLTLANISVAFTGKERGAAIGIWGAVSGLATAIGPLLGGLLVEKVSWQSIFYVNVPIGIVGLGVTAWAVRESRDERAPRSVDLFGLLTITVSIFCLVLALIQGNDADKGWTSGYILTLFAIAAVGLLVFVLGELRLKQPMVDPRLFTIPSFTGAAIAGFALSAGLFSLFFFLTLYMQNTLGFGALDAGLRFLPMTIPMFLVSPVSGRLIDRVGARPLLGGGLLVLAISTLLMARISPTDGPNDWTVLLPGLIVGGIGMGLVLPPIPTVAVGTVPRARAGMASGTNAMCRQVGNAVGLAFLGALLTARYNGYIHDQITALRAPGLAATAKASIIDGIQKAGTIAGSRALNGDPGHPNPYAHSPLFPTLSRFARVAFVDATIDILRVAAIILALGAICSYLLVRRSDMEHEQAPRGAPEQEQTPQQALQPSGA